jgi:hypothetical protein
MRRHMFIQVKINELSKWKVMCSISVREFENCFIQSIAFSVLFFCSPMHNLLKSSVLIFAVVSQTGLLLMRQ